MLLLWLNCRTPVPEDRQPQLRKRDRGLCPGNGGPAPRERSVGKWQRKTGSRGPSRPLAPGPPKAGPASRWHPRAPHLAAALTFITSRPGGHRGSPRASMASPRDGRGSAVPGSPALHRHSKFPALPRYDSSPRRAGGVRGACREV